MFKKVKRLLREENISYKTGKLLINGKNSLMKGLVYLKGIRYY